MLGPYMQDSLALEAAQAAKLAQQQESVAAAARSLAHSAPAATGVAQDSLQAALQACESARSTVSQQLGALPAALQHELDERQSVMMQSMQDMLASHFAELSQQLESRAQPVASVCTDSVSSIIAPVQESRSKLALADEDLSAQCSQLQHHVATSTRSAQQHAAALQAAASTTQRQVQSAADMASDGHGAAQPAVRAALSDIENTASAALVGMQQESDAALQRWAAAAHTLTSGAPLPSQCFAVPCRCCDAAAGTGRLPLAQLWPWAQAAYTNATCSARHAA